MRYLSLPLLFFLIFLGCSKKPAEKVTLEFRLAETKPAENLTEMVFELTGEKFYLHEEVVINNDDIAFARTSKWNYRNIVELTLTESGKEKWAKITQENLKGRMGMLIDGELVSAPIINAPILEGKAIIDGNFSEDEAEKISRGIVVS